MPYGKYFNPVILHNRVYNAVLMYNQFPNINNVQLWNNPADSRKLL